MDPDATLTTLRRLIAQAAIDEDGDYTTDLAVQVELLDDWLSAGGTKPVAWQH